MTTFQLSSSQVFITSIVLIVFTKTWISARANKLGKKFTILWIIVWSLVIIATLNLTILASIAGKLGIARGVDLIIYISLICVFYLIFSLAVQIHKLRSDLTKITRKQAIRESNHYQDEEISKK
jgi:hypothetical protein